MVTKILSERTLDKIKMAAIIDTTRHDTTRHPYYFIYYYKKITFTVEFAGKN